MKKHLLIISFLLSFLGSLYANHVVGARISYRNLGNQKYEVTLHVYRDCGGVPLNHPPITAMCSAGSKTFTIPKISVRDVTGIDPNCTQQSRCIGNYAYGFEEHIFKGVIDLSSLNCCEVTLSWAQCCRTGFITTGASYSNFYSEVKIDKCVGASIEWVDNPPQFILFVGRDHILNYSAIDSITHDSISYKSYTPLYTKGAEQNYTVSFTKDRPLTFLGFPNYSLSKPAGFNLDEARGNIYFRPTIVNEGTVIGIEATAWRKINGIMQVVGTSRNEQSVVVTNQGNNTLPYQDSPDIFKGCAGDTSVAIIDITNLNVGNTYEVSLKHNLRWAKAELLSGVAGIAKRRVAIFFITDSLTPNLKASAFTLEIKDNACPVRGRTVKTYGIEEGSGAFTDSSQIKKITNCGRPRFWIENNQTGSNFKYSWLIEGKFTKTQQKGDTIEVEANDTGWVKATLYATSTLHCNYYVYTDSVYISALDFVRVKAFGGGVTTCFGAPVNVNAVPQFGVAPYTYLWSTGQTGQSIAINPSVGTYLYNVEITDNNGCKALDTLTITNRNPSISLSGLDIVCPNSPFTLSSTISYTSLLPTFGWNGKNDNERNLSDSIRVPSAYTFRINDGGCVDSAQWQVDISKPQAQFSYPDSICIGDTLHLKAAPFGGKYPYTIFWNSYNRYGENISINTKNAAAGKSYFSVTITDSLGCTGTSSNNFTLVSPPIITFSPVPPVCQGGSLLNLTQYGNPTGGIWSGTNINNNQLNPQTASKGIQQLEYFYTDHNTSCSSKKTTQTKIYGSPQIDFTADSNAIYQGSTITFTNTTQADTTTQNRWELLGTNATYTTKNAAYTYTDTGIYSVKLWVNDGVCPPDSLTKTNYITVKPQPKNNISVNEIEKGGITVYPNPANVGFTIKTNLAIKSIEVYNSIGVKVVELTGNGDTEIHCDASSLTSGLYFITIQTQEGKHWVSPIFISH